MVGTLLAVMLLAGVVDDESTVNVKQRSEEQAPVEPLSTEAPAVESAEEPEVSDESPTDAEAAEEGSGGRAATETTERGDSTQGDSIQDDSTQGDSTQDDLTQDDSTQGDSTQGDSTQGDSTQSDSTEGEARLVRVLVLDLGANGVGSEVPGALTNGIAAQLAAYPKLEVISADDLRRMIELEADRESLGCATESCLAEVAGAMGAQYVVFGEVTRVETVLVADVRLFDAYLAKPAARISHKGSSGADLLEAVPSLTEPILLALGITPTSPVQEPEAGPNWMILGSGGVVAGLGAVAAIAGLAAVGLGQLALYTPGTGSLIKSVTWFSVIPAAGVAAAGLVGTAAGGGIAAWGAFAE